MRRWPVRGISVVVALAAGLAAASGGACGDPKSGIMLVVTTDMKAPRDLNAVSVTVSTNDRIKHNVIGRVTPEGDVLLPATLAIAEPDDPNASIRIRVIAFQERRARVLRDVRTSIPSGGRLALLRIPLAFVNDGSTQGELPPGVLPPPNAGTSASSSSGSPATGDGGSSGSSSGGASAPGARDLFDPFTFVPNCPNPEHTWIDGECRDAYVDPAALPDFREDLVGGSDPRGGCFDVAGCFARSTPVGAESARPQALTLDAARCSVRLNGADPARLNLAVVTPDTGECLRPGECYVPLDHGGAGWLAEGGEIKLPAFVCRLLERKKLALAASADCAPKTESRALCIAPAPGGPSAPARDAAADAVAEPVPFTDGVYAGVCVTVLANRDPAQAFRFYTDARYSAVPGGEGGTLSLSITPLRGWDTAANASYTPAAVSRIETRGAAVAATDVRVAGGGRFTAAFGRLDLEAEANSVSGRAAVIEDLVLDGVFSGSDRFCSGFAGNMTVPYHYPFEAGKNTCLFQKVTEGGPLPVLAAAEFVCTF